jgi:hypothetical protein
MARNPLENPMETGRRLFFSSIVVTLVGVKGQFAGQTRQGPIPRAPQIPDASGSAAPPDMPVPRRDPKEQLKENQKNLRRDADRLLQLAQELKDEADKTEQTDVLSLSLVHKAEEVEKLARQIKGLARSA